MRTQEARGKPSHELSARFQPHEKTMATRIPIGPYMRRSPDKRLDRLASTPMKAMGRVCSLELEVLILTKGYYKEGSVCLCGETAGITFARI